jgi:hypothetical protein
MATHCQSVKSLKEYFMKASREKEELEVKLEKAVDLQKELTKLKLSKDFMTENDMKKLREETAVKERRLSTAVMHHLQLQRVERMIALHKNSAEYLEPRKEQLIKNQIQFKISVIEKANKLQSQITHIERNPELLSETSLESLKKNLELLKNVLKKIPTQSQNADEAKKELLCVSCSRFPEIGTAVFSCREHHLLCSDCVKNNLKFCQICNQNFLQVPVTRNSLAERMIKTIR